MTIPAELIINIGTYANDSTGDDLRTAFEKVKNTFTYLDSQLGVVDAVNLGIIGAGIFAGKDVDNNLTFKRLTGSNGVTISSTGNTIDISALANVEGDTNPSLGGNLNLNGYFITGTGDIRSTVWGLDVRTINNSLQTLLDNPNFASTDLGTFFSPTPGLFDLGTF